MSPYLLTPHAHLCVVDGHAVFLDLKRDAYSALDRAASRLVSSLVEGWPASAGNAVGEPPRPETGPGALTQLLDPRGRAIAESLATEGLLTLGTEGRSARPAAVDAVLVSASAEATLAPIRPAEFHRFVSACIRAKWMLTFWPLQRAVRRVATRNAVAGEIWEPFDLERARPLLACYARMQPHAFSPYDACLRNSLTLLEFLAAYRLYPSWVFGVALAPFAAHCWLQAGPVVLNDSVGHVGCYTPIMVV
jgi:hypothetical protein